MKTIKSLLILSSAAFFCSLIGSGCYTQLAISPDEPETVISSLTTIIIEHPFPWPITPEPPTGGPIPHPPIHTPPAVVITSPVIVSESPASSPQRSTGYQRSSSSDHAQATSSDTGTRKSGSKRSGR